MSKKRANGEGSIRRKPNGRWEGRYTVGVNPATGKAIQRSVSGKTQAECKEKLKRAIQDNRGLAINHTGDYTVAEWCRLWFETYSKPNIRASTAYNYNNMIEHHIIPAIGAVKLRQLTSLQIQRMYNDTKTQGRVKRFEKTTDLSLSNSYVRGLHMMLHNCLQQAVKERLIPYNPCDNCRIPKKEKAEMKIIPPEKVGAYLKEAEQYGVLPIFYLELTSGLRRGELLALLWEDLDADSRIITINKQVTRQDGELVVSEPKTQNSIRKVAVPQQTVDLLITEHECHPDSPYMFMSPRTGGMWSPDAIGRIHKKLLAAAGIDTGVRFHDLRHPYVKPTTKKLFLSARCRLLDFTALFCFFSVFSRKEIA
ncbi:MAG: site-specific integrase [Oscillospiraceae bacterium]|nr:site-specific integrase [Oscillospiraceae bacterium]